MTGSNIRIWASAVAAGFLLGAGSEGLDAAGVESKTVYQMDLTGSEVGSEPEGLFVVDGSFLVAAGAEGKVLELGAEPLTEGLVLLGETLRGGGGIRARVRAERRGRSYPRFGVGLHGISGYRLRVVPALKAIELLKDDEVVARADFAWSDGAWTWIELKVARDEGNGALIEGRVWSEGGERPAESTVALAVQEARFNGKGVLSGTPYSGTPIRFDAVSISADPAAAGKK